MFRSQGNHLYLSNNSAEDVLPVSAALHNLIQKQGHKEIILDFENTTSFDAKFMLPLVTAARWHHRGPLNETIDDF
jgi:hypothetical protein